MPSKFGVTLKLPSNPVMTGIPVNANSLASEVQATTATSITSKIL